MTPEEFNQTINHLRDEHEANVKKIDRSFRNMMILMVVVVILALIIMCI